MLKKLMILILLVILAAGPIGCKKSEETPIQEEPTQTVEEMQEEAEQEITEENMDQELSELEEEIESETAEQ